MLPKVVLGIHKFSAPNALITRSDDRAITKFRQFTTLAEFDIVTYTTTSLASWRAVVSASVSRSKPC